MKTLNMIGASMGFAGTVLYIVILAHAAGSAPWGVMMAITGIIGVTFLLFLWSLIHIFTPEEKTETQLDNLTAEEVSE